MRIEADALRQVAFAITRAMGADADIAAEVARHLVESNLKGHDSHGVGMIPAYVAIHRAGNMAPNARAAITRDGGAIVTVDGRLGCGQFVAMEATRIAIERAQAHGIACVALRNSHHLGRVGTYGEACAAAGLISMHYVNVVGHAPAVVPWGGREARMLTNPYCCAIPRAGGDPLVLDMATSAIALGKVRVAREEAREVPPGNLVDDEGRPTTDPNVMYGDGPHGALMPFGLYKGYGLALVCELLGGALAGERTMQPGHERHGNAINNMLTIVLRPDAIAAGSVWQDEVNAMLDWVSATPAAADFDRVRVPGEPERESMARRIADGIPIDTATWDGIVRAAELAGVPVDERRQWPSA